MTTSDKHKKRTFYPPRTFDQDLAAFVKVARDLGWNFSGVDLEQLAQDAAEQSEARARCAEAEAHFLALRDELAVGQDARYRRFASALNAARAAFFSDPDVQGKLGQFKHSYMRSVNAESRRDMPEFDVEIPTGTIQAGLSHQ